jgi:hypothetical protein
LGWFHGIWTCGVEVLECWMIPSLKIQLNPSWKFQRNWNVHLVLLERSRWAGFNGILIFFGSLGIYKILIFHMTQNNERKKDQHNSVMTQ